MTAADTRQGVPSVSQPRGSAATVDVDAGLRE